MYLQDLWHSLTLPIPFLPKKGLNSLYAVPFPHKLHFPSNSWKLHQNSGSPLFVPRMRPGRISHFVTLDFNKKGQWQKSTWVQFCPGSKDLGQFSLCVLPPLECRSGIGICGREEWLLRIGRYKGHRRPLGIHQSATQSQGRTETDACTQLLQTPFRSGDMVSCAHQIQTQMICFSPLNF